MVENDGREYKPFVPPSSGGKDEKKGERKLVPPSMDDFLNEVEQTVGREGTLADKYKQQGGQ